MKKANPRKRGITLIVSLGVLTLMTLLAVLLVNVMALEHQAAVNHALQKQADLLAESGYDQAVDLIHKSLARHPWTDPRYPPAVLPPAPGISPKPEPDPWVYFPDGAAHPEDLGYTGELSGSDPRQRPSMAVTYTHETDAPLCPFGNHRAGNSELVSGVVGRDHYLVKVLDCSGRINLNDGDIADKHTLQPIIAMLAELPGMDVDKARALKTARNELPGRRFFSMLQAQSALDRYDAQHGIDPPRTWKGIRDFVTIYSPQFRVLKPRAIIPPPPGESDDILNQLPRHYLSASDLADMKLQAAQRKIEARAILDAITELRAPININVAPYPVLVAIFSGIKGHPFREDTLLQESERWWKDVTALGDKPPMESKFGFWRPGMPSKEAVEIPRDKAEILAQRIVSRRNPVAGMKPAILEPFKDWSDFVQFLEQEDLKKLLSREQLELLKVNANPNAMLLGRNPTEAPRIDFKLQGPPEETIGLIFEKANLTRWSTEVCFGSMGVFEIESLGRVISPRGGASAQSHLRRTVKVFEPLRITTELDFLQAALDRKRKDDLADRVRRPITDEKTAPQGWSVLDDLRDESDYDEKYKRSIGKFIALAPVNLGPGERSRGLNWNDNVWPIYLYDREDDVLAMVDGHLRMSSEWKEEGNKPTKGNLSIKTLAGGWLRDDTKDMAFEFGSNAEAVAAQDRLLGGGVLCWRAVSPQDTPPADWVYQDSYSRFGEDFPKTGGLEFMIRMSQDPTRGTDECWLALVIDDTAIGHEITNGKVKDPKYVAPSKLGTCLKIERYGTTLRLVWFYWGSDDGSGSGGVSRFTHCYAEVACDLSPDPRSGIDPWKAMQWHHVAVAWSFDNEVFAEPDRSPTVTTADNNPADGIKIWLWLDAEDVSKGKPATARKTETWFQATRQQIASEAVPKPVADKYGISQKATFDYRTWKLATVPQDPPALGYKLFMGGYSHELKSGTEVYRTGTYSGSKNLPLKRHTNAMIDDFFCYTPAPWKAGVKGPINLPVFRSKANYLGAFQIPTGAGCKPVAVTWSPRWPMPPNTSVTLHIGGATFLPNGTISSTSSSGKKTPFERATRVTEYPPEQLQLPDDFDATTTLRYLAFQFNLDGPSGSDQDGYGTVTPVVEDITLYVTHPPVVLDESSSSWGEAP